MWHYTLNIVALLLCLYAISAYFSSLLYGQFRALLCIQCWLHVYVDNASWYQLEQWIYVWGSCIRQSMQSIFWSLLRLLVHSVAWLDFISFDWLLHRARNNNSDYERPHHNSKLDRISSTAFKSTAVWW